MSSALNLTNPCIRLQAPSTKSVMDIESGQSGWTQPWAMWMDSNGKYWLRPNYSLYDDRDMGINLFITMRDDGVIVVDTTEVHNHLWTVESPGIAEACSIPVEVTQTDRSSAYL